MPMYNKMIINPFFKCTHFKISLLFRKLEMLRKFMYTSTQFRDMKHFTEKKQHIGEAVHLKCKAVQGRRNISVKLAILFKDL